MNINNMKYLMLKFMNLLSKWDDHRLLPKIFCDINGLSTFKVRCIALEICFEKLGSSFKHNTILLQCFY